MRIVLSLWLALTSLTAFAGIRVILGGGGYSEMVALSAWAQAGQFVKACIRQPELCFLSADQTKRISAALDQPMTRQLAFSNDDDQLHFETSRVILPSRWLYADEHTPKSLSDIHRVVLGAWLSQPELQLGAKGAILADALTGELSYNQNSFDMDKARLEIASIRSSRAITFIVSYVTADKAVDLTDEMRAQLNCGTRSAHLTAISDASVEDGHLLGKIQWLCDDEAYLARFVLEPISRRLVLISPSEIGTGGGSRTCEHALTGSRF